MPPKGSISAANTSSSFLVLDELLVEGAPEELKERYQYLASHGSAMKESELLNNIIVLDTETTGLSPYTSELIEIACVRLQKGKIVDSFQTFVKPTASIPPYIQELTGITGGDVVDAPAAQEAVARLAAFVQGDTVLAHNASFDRGFIEAVEGGTEVSKHWIDTLALSRIALPLLKRHNLQEMAAAFGCAGVSHRAMADVHALAGMWPYILDGLLLLPDPLLQVFSEMQPDVEWSYRPIFSCLLKSQKRKQVDLQNFSFANIRENLLKDNELAHKVDAADEAQELENIKRDEVAQAFEPGGILASFYEEFEARFEQKLMARQVAHALNTSSHLACEAGTGIGKSMAYLVPLAMYAQKNKVCCGVATKSNALADQLISHELPLLKEALPSGLTWASLKGYEHYACLRKVESALTNTKASTEEDTVDAQRENNAHVLTALATIMAYASQVPEGDIDTLGIRWSSVARNLVTTTSKECKRFTCPYFNKGCMLHGARRRAASADIVVTNHALLMCDIASEGRILPPIRNWVIDEAHSIEAEARQQWALTMKSDTLKAALEQLGSASAGQIKLLSLELARSETPLPAATHLHAAEVELRALRVQEPAFWSAVHDVLRPRKIKGGYQNAVLWLSEEVRNTPEFARLETLAEELAKHLSAAIDMLTRFSDTTRDMAEVSSESIAPQLRVLTSSYEALIAFFQPSNPKKVQSFFAEPVRRNHLFYGLKTEDLQTGPALATRLYPQVNSVVYCSATMAIGEDFSHFLDGVGLNELNPELYETLQLPSSYDMDEQMAALVCSDLPEPGQPNYLDALAEALLEIHYKMGGSVLTLFTNRADMEKLYKRLKEPLQEEGLKLAMQQRGANMRRLRETFVSEKTSSLFALKSFWEGFDAAGDTLRCVVIPKLPFDNPCEPLVQAREAYDARAWWNYSLPDAVLAVKQAAGRLIRTASDTGLLILLDSRLTTRRYGALFISSLPTKTVAKLSSAHLGSYIQAWNKNH